MKKIFINVGNTWTSIFFDQKYLKFKTNKLKDELFFFDKGVVAFIACVVSEASLFLEDYFTNSSFLTADNSSLDFSVIDNFITIGADRLANALACNFLYKNMSLSIDCGSCFTAELVNEDKQFLGGFILPGRQLQRQVLGSMTSSLPNLSIGEFPSEVIGKSTSKAIEVGIDKGLIGSLQYLIEEIKGKYDVSNFCFTGGDGLIYKKYFSNSVYVDDLTLQGLKIWSNFI